MNLLVFNLAMDADHSALGHATSWTNELARRCTHVSVITMVAGRIAVEENMTVYSLGKELGRSEPRRLVEFYRLVRRVLRERPIDACFAHMAPLFAVLFAPIAKWHRVPVLLWFAHASVNPQLRLAHALVDRCVTASPEGFRLRSDKLFVLGHGVDTEIFKPTEAAGPHYENTAVCVGRLAPIKHIDEMLAGIAILKHDRGTSVRLELVGGPLTAADREYEATLRRSAKSLGIEELITFHGPIPFHEVPPHHHRGRLSVNASETGAMDKAILEGMASGCIPISRNGSFRTLARAHGLEWLVPAGGPEGIADSIASVLDQSMQDRVELADRVRRIVVEEHSLSALADRIIAHLTELKGWAGARAR